MTSESLGVICNHWLHLLPVLTEFRFILAASLADSDGLQLCFLLIYTRRYLDISQIFCQKHRNVLNLTRTILCTDLIKSLDKNKTSSIPHDLCQLFYFKLPP